MNNLSKSTAPSGAEPHFAKVKDINDLNNFLLAQAEQLLPIWTNQVVERKGTELFFINITRNDNNLGSCSICLAKKKAKTGCFSDFADESFKGKGMVALFARLNGISMKEAYHTLLKQYPNPKHSGQVIEPSPEQEKTKKKYVKPDPIDETNETIPLPPYYLPIDKEGNLGEVSARYPYYLKDKTILFYQNRIEYINTEGDQKKTFCPCYWSSEKGYWVRAFPKGKLPLYNANAIQKSKSIIITEGEKCVNFTQSCFKDYAVVTSCKGSGNATKSDWTLVKGHDVIIIPDNNEPGYGYAAEVAALCFTNKAKSVSIVDVKKLGWADGTDIADQDPPSLDVILALVEPVKDVIEADKLDEAFFIATALLSDGDYDRLKEEISAYLGIAKRTLERGRKTTLGRANAACSWEETKDPDAPETGEEPEMTEGQLLEYCLPIAEDPFVELEKVFQRQRLVGERANATVMYLAIHSAHFNKPASVITKGLSGSGKSTTANAVTPLFPEEYVYDLTSGSNLSMIYEQPGTFEHTTIFLHEAGALAGKGDGSNSDFIDMVKIIVSENLIRRKVVQRDSEGNMNTETLEQKGPCNLITTSTKFFLDAEIETRCISTRSNSDPEHLKAIIKNIGESAMKSDEEEPIDFFAWRCFADWVRKGPSKVSVPYADLITPTFPQKETRAARDLNNLLSLVRAAALVNRYKREVTDTGYIVAELEDYRIAYDAIGVQIEDEHELTIAENRGSVVKRSGDF